MLKKRVLLEFWKGVIRKLIEINKPSSKQRLMVQAPRSVTTAVCIGDDDTW